MRASCLRPLLGMRHLILLFVNTTKPMSNCFFYAFATSVVSFIYTLILFFLGFHGEKMEQGQLLAWGGLVILAVGLFLAVRAAKAEKVEAGEGFSYGNGFSTAFLTSVFVAVFSAILAFVYASYINPEMADHAWRIQEQAMIEQGMSDEQIGQVEGFTRTIMKPGLQAVFGFFGSLVTGLILSLIIAIFTRKKVEDDLGTNPAG